MLKDLVSRQMCWLLTVIIAGAGTFVFVTRDLKAEPNKEDEQAISLSIAAVLNAPGPTFAFTVTNNSEIDFPYYEPGHAPLVFITPDGGETEFALAGGALGPGFKQRVVKPNESITMKMDMFERFGSMRFKTPGLYKVYWKIGKRYKSNEIPILREKGTPIFNAATGRAEPEELFQDNEEYR